MMFCGFMTTAYWTSRRFKGRSRGLERPHPPIGGAKGGQGGSKKGGKLNHDNPGKGKAKTDQANEASTEANATTEEQADILASKGKRKKK
eukprot:41132-Amphidinium_carterae.1